MDVDFIGAGNRLQKVPEKPARHASRAGFSGIVFAEGGRTAYLSVAAAALAVDDLDLNTGIAVAFPRSPMVTAEVAWAGEVADGVHVHPFHSRAYLDQVVRPKLAEGAARAGRDPAAVELAVPVFTVVGDTEEERRPWREQARSQIAFYGSTRNYAFQFDILGYQGTSARLNERLKAGDPEGMAALISDDMLRDYTVEATWDELSDLLLARYGDVARRLILYFGEPARRRDPRLFDRFGEVARDVRARSR